MASHLGLPEFDFIQRYTRLTVDRRGLTLIEGADGACVFLSGENCLVQPVKPQQCRDFPNLWNFPGFEKLCRAVPREVGTGEWKEKIRSATGRIDVSPDSGPVAGDNDQAG